MMFSRPSAKDITIFLMHVLRTPCGGQLHVDLAGGITSYWEENTAGLLYLLLLRKQQQFSPRLMTYRR